MENDDPELGVELQAKDLNAVLVTQPVNSPYWNKIPHMNKGKMELECEGNLPTILGVIDMTGQLRDSMDATIIIDEDKMTDNDNESENTIILVHDAFTSSKKR